MMFSKETAVKDPNGTFRARSVPYKASRSGKRSKNIAAVDFGTKNCSLAYITENDKLEITRGIPKLPLNGTYLRVPTAVLFNASGTVESFGHDARLLYTNLEDHEREGCAYFEEIKMNLHRDQEVSRELQVTAMNGKSYYLVDVISHILRFLKEEFLIRHLKKSGHSFSINDFDWVITVPAIWKARGKQLMREAGYKAGLCSEQPLSILKEASFQPPLLLSEPHPDRLCLALEPESASLYCHEMLKRGLVAQYCENLSGSYSPHTYLLVDIGGGTVDISAHKVKYNGNSSPVVEELHPPVGNSCGGTRVNREFVKFLKRLVNDLDFSSFIGSCDTETSIRNRCELNHLINVTFEEQKQTFGRLPKDRRQEIVIRLPVAMLDIYKDELTKGIQTVAPYDVKLVRQNLRISVSKMEEFFQPVIVGIISCISLVINKLGGQIDVIYLVGGFGGCPYLYWKILDEFGISYKCIVPPNPEYAVVEGAVLFHADPSVIHSRRANATYGKSVIRPFENKIHNREHLFYEDKIPFCENLFQVIIEISEVIQPGHVYMCTSVPRTYDQKNMCIELYCTPCKADEVWYVTGERSGKAVKIGEVVIDLECDRRQQNRDKCREVDFFFDFSQTEIQVTAYERATGREVKTVIDFLSS